MAWTKEQRRLYFREYRRGRRLRKLNKADLSRVPYGVSQEFKAFAQVKFI